VRGVRPPILRASCTDGLERPYTRALGLSVKPHPICELALAGSSLLPLGSVQTDDLIFISRLQCLGYGTPSGRRTVLQECVMIKKVKNGYRVMSEKGKNLGGPYKTKKEAEKRLRQVEFFKHKGH
jgi:hypothetical protein